MEGPAGACPFVLGEVLLIKAHQSEDFMMLVFSAYWASMACEFPLEWWLMSSLSLIRLDEPGGRLIQSPRPHSRNDSWWSPPASVRHSPSTVCSSTVS